MPDLNPFRQLARRTPTPVSGLLEYVAGAVSDVTDLKHGLPSGTDLDAWDPDHIQRTLPILDATFGKYFRGEVRGLENIPADGPALLVGNHSGGTMIADTFVFALRFYEHFGPQRRFHQLAHVLAARLPMLGTIRRYGTVEASHENARRAFKKGAPVLVYPGGDYETFRPTWHGDQIEFGGRQGFIKLALEEGVPIVPVVAIGGQETALFVTRGQRLAKLTRLDKLARIKVLPVSLGPPFGINLLDLPGRMPLPAKITIQVLPPVNLREQFGAEPDVDRIYKHVTDEMQDALTELSDERSLPLVG
jgi:1-acyl-sn-glycerol-3-phosphate acyltransferase